ncbi:hypothetical protein C8J56DRAFT_911399 [Mycena floridula]|nr:hypothetical protein C8J56DRAFT_911399 [Mycena floridula]
MATEGVAVSELSEPLMDTSRPVGLKRRASTPLENGESSRKRIKEDLNHEPQQSDQADQLTFAEDLEQELQCGCCSELVYRPVLVSPCQHFFCGSCCVLWVRNGGSNCPACRQSSTIVVPFRALQKVVDTFLKHAPHKARTERERQQADEVYKPGASMRIPIPREKSPEPNINLSTEFLRPCPHCSPDNQWGWQCPNPIGDPSSDNPWRVDDGSPPGHGHCGNCENLLALQAPTTTKCDFCQVSFCGIDVPGRCLAHPLLSQQPHPFTDVGDLILSPDVYECFSGNTVEVEIMLDYLTAQRLTPAHIYREIVQYMESQPSAFKVLIENELFIDLHSVSAGIDPDPDAPRTRICRPCSSELLINGLKDWWIRERQKGFLEESVLSRKDCPDGSLCHRQKDLAHAKDFNHIPSISTASENQADPGLEAQDNAPSSDDSDPAENPQSGSDGVVQASKDPEITPNDALETLQSSEQYSVDSPSMAAERQSDDQPGNLPAEVEEKDLVAAADLPAEPLV